MSANRRCTIGLVLMVSSVCAAASMPIDAAAQQPPAPRTGARNVVARVSAVRVPNGTITVDGTMAEPEWQRAAAATDFVQQQPVEGARAQHQSEVRFLYDEDYLYIGGALYEDEPGQLITNELKRDFNPRDGDLFVVVLDTFHDKLNSYDLQINPGCALRDSQSYDDGRTVNANWDAVWFCRSSVVGGIWYVEMSIPFKQLRFPNASADQLWGLQIFRLVRHTNEWTVWNPVPRNFNQFKTSFEGELDGIRGVQPGRNIRLKPFATSQFRSGDLAAADARDLPCQGSDRQFTCDGGVDAKIGIGSSLVFDGTYRTDFSNVEVDAQQINLTRFNLFFPEKRDFFLENSGAFQVGPPAASNSNLVPFFSRTIGLSTDQTDERGVVTSRGTGNPIPTIGGVRLSGKVGRNAVGLLNMETGKEQRLNGAAPLPASNFTVLRYGREFLSNSLVGAFFMDKERGAISNRVVGTDIRFYPTRAWNIVGMVMRSTKTGFADDSAWRGGVQYDKGLNQASINYTSLGTTFQDDLGFVPRQGVHILNVDALRRWRPTAIRSWVREFRPALSTARYTGIGGGEVQTATVAPTFTTEFGEGSTLLASYTRDEEALSAPFRPQGIPTGQSIPAGRYVFYTGDLLFSPQNGHVIAPTFDYRFGDYYNGTRTGFTAGARVRFSPKLATTLSVSHDTIVLPNVSFDTNLASFRIDASFSTRMFLYAFVQYNTVTHQALSNIRYDFIHHPLSDLFLTYNDTRDSNGVLAPSRQLAIKFTHLISL